MTETTPIPLPKVFTATIAHTNHTDHSGHTFNVQVDQTLLQAAELAGRGTVDFQFDSSCRNGTCRTCMCRLVEGDVAYRIEWPGLSLDEKRDGFILPCVAYAVSDLTIELVI